MVSVPKSKDEFKVGDVVYFYEFDDSVITKSYGQWKQIQSARVTRTTPKFCELDRGDGKLFKKKKENLFLDRDKTEVLFFKFFDARFKEEFNVSCFDIVRVFQKQSDKYPELFI